LTFNRISCLSHEVETDVKRYVMAERVTGDELIGVFDYLGDPSSDVKWQSIGTYKCPCKHPACCVIALACVSVNAAEIPIQDTIIMSPDAWRAAIPKIEALLKKSTQ
jgi:hypothetical protein